MTTEREMIAHLDRRYAATNPGNGPRYAKAAHVKSNAGFYARRSMDYLAVDLWPSTGLTLSGHEIKCSRGDWLRELKDPTKAEEFKQYMDQWFLVVSDAAIVKPDELPEGWGLIALAGSALRIKVAAPRLAPKPMPKSMLACALRATQLHAYGRGHRDGYDTWTADADRIEAAT